MITAGWKAKQKLGGSWVEAEVAVLEQVPPSQVSEQ